MAVRQYIGARYVIKIYENSVDPSTAEWESSTNYERLTMVTYNFGSYLSKKDVPASVGNPADNPSYWVQTGFYNGQIASLQSQIDTINNTTIPNTVQSLTDAMQTLSDNVDSEIDEMNDKIDNLVFTEEGIPDLTADNVLLITDSFGVNPNGNVLTGFQDCLNTPNAIGQGGASYTEFAQIMDDFTGDKTAITSIILIGGTNEHNTTDIPSKFAALKTSLQSYPNAKLYIAFIKSNFNSSTERALVNSLVTVIKEQCVDKGFYFLGNFNEFMYPTYANVQSDGVHLLPNSGARVGTAIFNKFANGVMKALRSATYSATDDNGLTFEIRIGLDDELSVFVTGTTLNAIGAGGFIETPFDVYYYTDSLPQSIRSTPLVLPNGGKLIFGIRDNKLKYYYSPEGSGSSTLPAGTLIMGYASMILEMDSKKYKVTNS